MSDRVAVLTQSGRATIVTTLVQIQGQLDRAGGFPALQYGAHPSSGALHDGPETGAR